MGSVARLGPPPPTYELMKSFQLLYEAGLMNSIYRGGNRHRRGRTCWRRSASRGGGAPTTGPRLLPIPPFLPDKSCPVFSSHFLLSPLAFRFPPSPSVTRLLIHQVLMECLLSGRF